MAAINGLQCTDEVPFQRAMWAPTYELRRHHVGKSFQRRVQNCTHYCFRLVKINSVFLVCYAVEHTFECISSMVSLPVHDTVGGIVLYAACCVLRTVC
jgi:hypothetical protein